MVELKSFVKKEAVLCVAVILAVISMFFVRPDEEYISYIDFRTLAILFCLMTIVASFRTIGVFKWLAERLLSKVDSLPGIVLVLVLLCFFMSMFVTNDVALITFVPFAIIVLGEVEEKNRSKWVISCVVMQTIAANLGSMLMPIGNPQNLFLYGKAVQNESYHVTGMWDFIRFMLPYSIISLVLLLLFVLISGILWKNDTLIHNKENDDSNKNVVRDEFVINYPKTKRMEYIIAYGIFFVISLLAVAHKIHYIIPFIMIFVYSFVRNKRTLVKVDYSLLGTFVGLFIFIGNLGRIPAFSAALKSIMKGNEVITAVLASQVMSNVPAAVLLEKFTENVPALIIGTNLGGLGTIIASMASLISFKYISREKYVAKGRYLLVFTVANILFLIVLLGWFYCEKFL